jgi:hypothetical protein
MEMIQLQEQLIGEIVDLAPGHWDAIELHYELLPWEGEWAERYSARWVRGDDADGLLLSHDALELLRTLNEAKPDGQQEKWTWLDFHLASDGRYSFDFQYDMPPMLAAELKTED